RHRASRVWAGSGSGPRRSPAARPLPWTRPDPATGPPQARVPPARPTTAPCSSGSCAPQTLLSPTFPSTEGVDRSVGGRGQGNLAEGQSQVPLSATPPTSAPRPLGISVGTRATCLARKALALGWEESS